MDSFWQTHVCCLYYGHSYLSPSAFVSVVVYIEGSSKTRTSPKQMRETIRNWKVSRRVTRKRRNRIQLYCAIIRMSSELRLQLKSIYWSAPNENNLCHSVGWFAKFARIILIAHYNNRNGLILTNDMRCCLYYEHSYSYLSPLTWHIRFSSFASHLGIFDNLILNYKILLVFKC